MTHQITIPAGTDRYGLVSDLQVMASDISTHLDTLDARIDGNVASGSSPTFSSLSTESAPTFPGITVSGNRPTSSIKNNVNGFGLESGTLRLGTTDSSTWVSSGPIIVPNGGTGTQAINRNALDTEVATLNATIAALTARVATLETNHATKAYVDSKDTSINATLSSHTASISSLSTQLGTKANAYGTLTNVASANYASSAGSASSATNANNSTHFRGRSLAVGSFYAGSLSGGQSSQKAITHNLGYTPVVLAMAFGDQGVMSIVCSIETISTTNAVIKYRNLNNSTSEAFSVNWVAI